MPCWTSQVSVRVVRPPAGWTRSTRSGRRTSTWDPSGNPRPVGRNESVCGSSAVQCPGTLGVITGVRVSHRLQLGPGEGQRDRSVRCQRLVGRRLGDHLHALARGKPAHAQRCRQPLPRAWRRADTDGAGSMGAARDVPDRHALPWLRESQRAGPAGIAEHDEPHRLVERNRDRLAGRHLQPAPAQLGARGDEMERLVGGMADEPACPGRALHGDVDRQLLTGRHGPPRPEPAVANVDRDRLAAARAHCHVFDSACMGGLLDRGERSGIGAEADVRPGEQGRGGGARAEEDHGERPEHGLPSRPPSRPAAELLNGHAFCIPRGCEGNAMFSPLRQPDVCPASPAGRLE